MGTFYVYEHWDEDRCFWVGRAAGDGPASPREIFDVLKAGGFQFETKNDDVALVSLRATLRKNNRVFHRLPTGTYGLLTWYPNAKPPKESTKVEVEESDEESVSDFDASLVEADSKIAFLK